MTLKPQTELHDGTHGWVSPGAVAEADQLGAALQAIAPALAQYHRALESEGLLPAQATELTVAYQRWLLTG